MELIVTEKKAGPEWRFNLNSNEVYEILCSQMAWRTVFQTDWDKEKIQRSVVHTVDMANDRTMEELSQVSDPFIRLVLMEVKRLNIKLINKADL